MREFVYFSRKARTSGNWKDLMKAGRMDIVCHFIIHSFFLSNSIRDNVRLHLIFYGPPDPPKHLEISNAGIMSKKDISGLIKRMLYKYKKGRKTEVFPGCFIEKKDLISLARELKQKGKNIYILDRKGIDIEQAQIKNKKDNVFIIGDQEGLLPREKKLLKKEKAQEISIGDVTYLATQALIILQNHLDRRK
jgi:tRNA pseudouridine-54 N-methylase